MEAQRIFHTVEITDGRMLLYAILNAVDGSGGAVHLQCHQGFSIEAEKGGEILLPAVRQQRFQAFLFLHHGAVCRARFS
ncbi:hypothetical protein D3C87_1729740 [compost metagenome]